VMFALEGRLDGQSCSRLIEGSRERKGAVGCLECPSSGQNESIELCRPKGKQVKRQVGEVSRTKGRDLIDKCRWSA
jgi:hypothetical protein